MYKNILIPVMLDDSRNTDQAIQAAKTLAAKGADFTLLHIVELIPVYVAEYLPTDVSLTQRKAVKAEMDALCQKLPNCRSAVADGKPGSTICQWAADNDCDCIVIASHQPGFADIFLGSTAHHVVRHAGCAVHVIR